jgi:S-adenosylmethionine:tRNA ribosyltransferase-isomerase
MWAEMRRRYQVLEVTLAVGIDTFRPVSADDLADHALHTEAYEVGEEAARAIDRARGEGRRIVAVGTTSVRVLETIWGAVPAGPLSGRSGLFITPGYAFAATGAMVTNFHLPRSTLLAMVMAFAGIDEVRRLYHTAVDERYRFYSFGDAMLIA